MRKLYCLLGDPVAHSRSPAIHARAFSFLGVDAVYAPCRVSAADLAAAIAGLRALGAAGFNVTVPHKEQAARLVDRLAPSAESIAAVSCVTRSGEELVGHNTDAAGLLRALRAHRVAPDGAEAVVVGAGGSARAAVAALAGRVRSLTVVNRTEAKARDLAERASVGSGSGSGPVGRVGTSVRAGPLGGDFARRALSSAGLVVHCTTVGMGTDELPFDPSLLAPSAAVVDLVYAGPHGTVPGETALLLAARARGLRTVDGIDVLVHQAIASLEIWLGRPDLAELAKALRAAAFEEVDR